MFSKYRLGYYALLSLATLDFLIGFSFGTASTSDYFSLKRFVIRTLPVWSLIPLCWAALIAFELTRRRVDKPLSVMRRILFRHRHWLGRGLLFVVVIMLIARSITSFKSAIPNYVPYYADPWLADIDRAIFGIDPWRLTHVLFGPIGTVLIDRAYMLWFPIMMLYIGWFCFSRNQVLQLRGLLTFLLCWAVLGNFVALAVSSVGPCFYERFYHDPQFEPLMSRLRAIDADHPLFAFGAMDFLVASIGKSRFGAGISAMPSLHVSIAFLCFLVAWEYGRHWWAKLLGFLFFAAISVGSVHLGWHYASDGIVGIIVTGLLWWGTGRFVDWLDARDSFPSSSGEGERDLAATPPSRSGVGSILPRNLRARGATPPQPLP